MAEVGEEQHTTIGDASDPLGHTSFNTTIRSSTPATPFPRPQTTDIAITIDPVAFITTECITITSAMRKHARWAQSSVSAILGGGASRLQETEIQRTLSQSRRGENKKPSIPDPATRRPSYEEDMSLASRWGLRGRRGRTMQDNPLLAAFARLRRDLAGVRDFRTVDAPSLLHPFLQVIRSSSTSAVITSLAVVSITKFFSYNILTIHSPRISLAMHLLSAAITHCRFEASDTSADEVVLLRILRLMENVMTRPEGGLLGDQSVCEMISTGLSMCCQARLSEVLKRSAEMAMVTMSQVVFGRLKNLPVEKKPEGGRGRSNTAKSAVNNVDEVKIESPVNGTMTGGPAQEERPSIDAPQDGEARTSYEPKTSLEDMKPTAQASTEDEEDPEPYGLPSVKELFRVLIGLLDPHDRNYTDVMRIMALRVIDVALEVAGPSIAEQYSLALLVEDDLCRHLFQLVRSENTALLHSSLRVAGTLLATCRNLLKLQQELYLSYLVACLHPRVDIPQEPGIDPSLYEGVPQAPKLVKPAPSQQPSSGRSTPVPVKDRQKLGMEGGLRKPEAREAMVESIGTLVRIPSFMVELFVNYDCEVDRQDLCEDMVGLLSRNAFPDSATWSTVNVPPLCLDSLLSFVQFIAERLDHEPPTWAEERIKQLQSQRVRKKIIKDGAAKFNDDPTRGIAFLVQNGIIADPDNPKHIAQFLKGTTHVSKKMLGEYLTKKSNTNLLTEFIELFNFDGRRIDEALREILGSFRLPGESALIERIVKTFTEKYCNSLVPEGIANEDAAFVLTYAIIMLNTDLYNPNVAKNQKRMTQEDFARNLRGVNDGKDFAPEYLQEIYEAIKENEIILPEEHENKNAFEYAWKELLMKTHEVGRLELCNTNAFDAEMFRCTWKPIIATLCYVFMSASDEAVFNRVVVGFAQCADIAARYGVTEAFDRIVFSLSKISTLAAEIPPSTSLNTEVQVEKKKVMVSELAVRLGRDYRAQLAFVLLFRSLAGHEEAIGETWIYIVRIVRNLFVNSLITLNLAESSRMTQLDPIPLSSPSQIIDRDGKLNESGIFSTFTSYLSSYANDDPPEPSEEELENTLSSADAVNSASIHTVLKELCALPAAQLKSLVAALLSGLPEEPSPVVSVKPERPLPVTARVNGHRTPKAGPEYSPAIVFALEFATIICLRDDRSMAATGEIVTTALQTAVRDASNLHPLTAARSVHYLLDMLRLGFSHDFMRVPVVLHAISSFDDTVLDNTASSIMPGLSRCIATPGPLRNDITNSPDFWSILQRLHRHKLVASQVFSALQSISSPSSLAITSDNYESTISLCNDFATSGSLGHKYEQARDAAVKRNQKLKPLKPEYREIIDRALEAINIIVNLTSLIPGFISQSHLEAAEAWAAYWSPIFRALCTQSINPCREVRHRALSALHRVLLSPDLANDAKDARHTEWIAIFEEVLFPLTLRLLKPETYQLDVVGMPDTRVHMANILTKIFLRYLDYLVERERLLTVWKKTLELLDRLMNAGVGVKEDEILGEAVSEGVKNCLLVMAGSGYLKQPDRGEEANEVWKETGKWVERLTPGLMAELFPPPSPPPAAAPQQDEEGEQMPESAGKDEKGKDKDTKDQIDALPIRTEEGRE